MADRLLRVDEHGLYVQTGCYTFRPLDALRSADPAAAQRATGWRITETSSHTAGSKVPVRHLGGSPVTKVADERWFAYTDKGSAS
ncbi:hypothetical protein [Nocardioides pakistanensis]